jgi:hypothetical protein
MYWDRVRLRETYPAWQIIAFEFPARGDQPALKLTWYDGGKLPTKLADLADEADLSDNGIRFEHSSSLSLSRGKERSNQFPAQVSAPDPQSHACPMRGRVRGLSTSGDLSRPVG